MLSRLTSLCSAGDIIGGLLSPPGTNVPYAVNENQFACKNKTQILAQMFKILYTISSCFEMQEDIYTFSIFEEYNTHHTFVRILGLEVKKRKSWGIFLSAINISVCYLLPWKFRYVTELCNSVIQIGKSNNCSVTVNTYCL